MLKLRRVCLLPQGRARLFRELWANHDGKPYIITGSGLYNLPSKVSRADREVVEAWQMNPDNDVLRARGDAKWQAACAFCARPTRGDKP